MDFKVFTKELELTPALKNYVEKRMTKVDKLLKRHSDLISPADFRISKEGGKYKTEITTHFKKLNNLIKVEEREGDLYECIDKVTDSFERKIKKLKDKLQTHEPTNNLVETFKFPEAIDEMPIVKRKRYDLSVMSGEEALLQAEMLGHNFFVFRNSETDEVNVVYKRNAENFGIIEFNS
ncbi:ribosomal subunit interface protein [Tepiditoga spiralis]|uniref:Ribosome hibernation promoting factor n=1 Tax=Tepiditoga spiralis TaxID=2108365 RepID=A0A7G1GA19_9BACT|nr:ribosome-associated translation inhibitor RaiA [Tepiditoga spiralis]BBE30952.1 ribosomal subunit interface protein [Tepiditoga spiralis]